MYAGCGQGEGAAEVYGFGQLYASLPRLSKGAGGGKGGERARDADRAPKLQRVLNTV